MIENNVIEMGMAHSVIQNFQPSKLDTKEINEIPLVWLLLVQFHLQFA